MHAYAFRLCMLHGILIDTLVVQVHDLLCIYLVYHKYKYLLGCGETPPHLSLSELQGIKVKQGEREMTLVGLEPCNSRSESWLHQYYPQ